MKKYTAYISATNKSGGRAHILDGNSLDNLKRRARAWARQFAPLSLATVFIHCDGIPHCKSLTHGEKWTPWKHSPLTPKRK